MKSYDFDEGFMDFTHSLSDECIDSEYETTGDSFWKSIPHVPEINEENLFAVPFISGPPTNNVPPQQFILGEPPKIEQKNVDDVRNRYLCENVPIDDIQPHFIPFGLDKQPPQTDGEKPSPKAKPLNQHFIATHQIMYLFQRFNVLSMETCQQFCSIDARRIYDIMNALEFLRLIKKVPGRNKKTSNYQLISDIKTNTPIDISKMSQMISEMLCSGNE
ncbi:hypothetical protein TRFO_37782 [Tritrichomonas foetus]|uniref:E2F/DP family winged-helix DNA-binding domain-containing protein n=1 Tax=Tritrichomonas foetus TaxID=1144522 RepID=A0A1J4JA81_9EUKA|nr:hypothetical protein TRFO_37782 [Tritrichomonas foetus]|eukprot:OHS96082.1 hypothetical protein TRFO_37782 [Tritrichomonas foetus]